MILMKAIKTRMFVAGGENILSVYMIFLKKIPPKNRGNIYMGWVSKYRK